MNKTYLATGMNRRPVRMLAGFSSSGPNFRLRPISNTSCAQDTEGLFEDEAAAGASVMTSAGALLEGEAAAAGVAPNPETGANGGGSEDRGTSSRRAATSGAAVVCVTSPLAELVVSELVAERGGDACFVGFVFLLGGAFTSFFFFFDGVASRCEVCSGSSSSSSS